MKLAELLYLNEKVNNNIDLFDFYGNDLPGDSSYDGRNGIDLAYNNYDILKFGINPNKPNTLNVWLKVDGKKVKI